MNKSHNQCVDAENEACHGSCIRKPRARLSFPVTTGVMANEELRIEELKN